MYLAMQSIALGGAIVTGTLARERRLKLEQLNSKLRQVNSELIKRHSQAVSILQPDSAVHLMSNAVAFPTSLPCLQDDDVIIFVLMIAMPSECST